ncbi:citrate synthase [Nocardioides sp. HB32]
MSTTPTTSTPTASTTSGIAATPGPARAGASKVVLAGLTRNSSAEGRPFRWDSCPERL